MESEENADPLKWKEGVGYVKMNEEEIQRREEKNRKKMRKTNGEGYGRWIQGNGRIIAVREMRTMGDITAKTANGVSIVQVTVASWEVRLI